MDHAKRTTLITGVSSGIGHAVAQAYLSSGATVYGLSRREPAELLKNKRLRFAPVDFTRHDSIRPALDKLLHGAATLDIAVLNAGTAGKFGDIAETDLGLIRSVMDVNAWANKVIIDHLLTREANVSQIVAISTGASISGARGWNAYSLSKAALNMLIRLYSREFPETHFCAVAPGLVDTAMLKGVLSLPSDGTHPTIDRLKGKRGTPDLVTPEEAAKRLVPVIDRLPHEVESGSYVDIREMVG
jgi:NAD(P)-dependent dehydrogenase (short-subunit alcohol dehydrogenase family)